MSGRGRGPSPYEALRYLDNLPLTAFERSLIFHMWRVGHCFQKQRTLAAATGMSQSQVGRCLHRLKSAGYVAEAVIDNRVGLIVVFDSASVSDPPRVRLDSGRVTSDPASAALPIKKASLSMPHEESPADPARVNYNNTAPGGAPTGAPGRPDEDPGMTGAQAAAEALIAFWEELTVRSRPVDGARFRGEWLAPLNQLWLRCGRDVARAQALLRQKRAQMLGDGLTPFRPAAVVPAIVADLDLATAAAEEAGGLF